MIAAIRTVGRRLKASPRLGAPASRADEMMRNCALWLNLYRRRLLRAEWAACVTPPEILAFCERHLQPGQRATEILEFAHFARVRSPEVFCEIGTLRGGTHVFLTHALPSVRTTIAIDWLIQRKAFQGLLRKRGQRAWFLNAPSQLPKTVEQVADRLRGQSIDLLFIDGDHSYDGVRSDFQLYRQFVRDDGLIAFHDICEDNRTRLGYRTCGYVGDVPKFWRRLRDRYVHREFIEAADQDGYGIGVIIYSAAATLPDDL